VILNQTRLGLPPDRETLLQLVVVVVVVFSIPPLWWLATLSLTWWRERGA
jgi:hypothetical protein